MFGKDKSIEKHYLQLISQYSSSVQRFQKRGRIIGLVRLVIFVLFLYCFYLFLKTHGAYIYLIISAIGLILFVILIKVHQKIRAQKDLANSLLNINCNEINIYKGNDSELDDGKVLGSQHTSEDDLDLFGQKSLFHLLNRCGTYAGIKQLGKEIVGPPLKIDVIRERQVAIQELSQDITLRQNTLANGLLLDELRHPKSLQKDFAWHNPPNYYSALWNIVLIVWPLIMIVVTVHFYFTLNAYPLTTAFLLGLGIASTQLKYTQQGSSLVSGKRKLWSHYSVLFKLIQESRFDCKVLNAIKSELGEAYLATKALSKLSNSYDHRLNLLVFVFLNAYFLYDIHQNRRLAKWIASHRQQLPIWIEQLGQFESLSSLATFHYNYPAYIIPTLTEERIIRGVDVGHPLIDEKKRVHNQINFGPDKHLFIITGSNMSGKSTFLRMIGLNHILAMLGAPVCAGEMVLKPMPIYSSIRISDSLQEETSYFYAELKKLKQILSDLDKGPVGLVLLDEVLKGTNSEDKLYGAKKLLEKLVLKDSLTFLATHILTLGELTDKYPESIDNYCFESTIDHDTLHFDYKLHHGVAQHRNATFLMEQMGII